MGPWEVLAAFSASGLSTECDHAVVAPELGEGIGGAILDGVPDEAKRRLYSRIYLFTFEDNERSHRLYRKPGLLTNWPNRRR